MPIVGLKCRKLCWDSCANTLYVSTIFPSEKLSAQVLVCLLVGSSVGSSVDVGCTGTCVPIDWVEVFEVLRMLDAQVLECLSVRLKCWKFCGCWMYRY